MDYTLINAFEKSNFYVQPEPSIGMYEAPSTHNTSSRPNSTQTRQQPSEPVTYDVTPNEVADIDNQFPRAVNLNSEKSSKTSKNSKHSKTKSSKEKREQQPPQQKL